MTGSAFPASVDETQFGAALPKGGSGVFPDELASWLDRAQPGQRIEYWRGALAIAIDAEQCRTSRWDSRPVREIADMAYDAWEWGKVELVQRREGVDDFAYLAVARSGR